MATKTYTIEPEPQNLEDQPPKNINSFISHNEEDKKSQDIMSKQNEKTSNDMPELVNPKNGESNDHSESINNQNNSMTHDNLVNNSSIKDRLHNDVENYDDTVLQINSFRPPEEEKSATKDQMIDKKAQISPEKPEINYSLARANKEKSEAYEEQKVPKKESIEEIKRLNPIKEKKKDSVMHEYSQNMLQFLSPYAKYQTFETKPEVNEYPSLGYIRLHWLDDCSNLSSKKIPKCSRKDCLWKLNKFCKIEEYSINKKIWICQGCGEKNLLDNDADIPKYGTTLEKIENDLEELEKKSTQDENIKIILCLDVSPSMDRTIVIEGKYLERVVNGNKMYTSYFTLVKESLCNLIDKIAKERPNALVGLITFSSEITIYGDGHSNEIKKIGESSKDSTGEFYFSNADRLLSYADNLFKDSLKFPIKVTKDLLKKTINKIKLADTGCTPLGPCLTICQSLLRNSQKGSEILVFTDGGANFGFGKLTDLVTAKEKRAYAIDKTDKKVYEEDDEKADGGFYRKIAEYFKNKGIVVSIFTFGKDECSLNYLSPLVDQTQGLMGRYPEPSVAPEIKIPYYMDNIRNIKIELDGEKGLYVKGIDCDSMQAGKLYVRKRVGILCSSAFFFTYKLLKVYRDGKPDFYVQVRISYKNGDTRYLRTITEKIILLKDMEERKIDFTDFDILLKYAGKITHDVLANSAKEAHLSKEKLSELDSNKNEVLKKLEEIDKIIYDSSKIARKDFALSRIRSLKDSVQKNVCNDKVVSEVTATMTQSINDD